MAKTITLYLLTSPFDHENTLTATRIAESALEKGHKVNLIASADGVYCFLKGPGGGSAEELFSGLMAKGLQVYL
ncbi:MAG: DsrE family protein [Nitrospiraceae bacterium]|nr:DsrE family protein [Nitrospiraceae bacterium]